MSALGKTTLGNTPASISARLCALSAKANRSQGARATPSIHGFTCRDGAKVVIASAALRASLVAESLCYIEARHALRGQEAGEGGRRRDEERGA